RESARAGRPGLGASEARRPRSGRALDGPPGDLLHDRIRRPQHLVGGLDRLRRHLVGTLAGDESDQLLDHADVRVLEETLQQRTAVVLTRGPDLRRARGVALLEEVLPDRAEARRVREAGGLELADLRRRRPAREDRA